MVLDRFAQRRVNPASSLAAVTAAALVLLWPAFVNGYPILYSDTGGFLEQALMPDIGWDKPWIYGPFLTPFHLRLTLWPAAFAQSLILSAALWLTQAATTAPRAATHLALCSLLALGSAAPWFASLLMPDMFAPVTVLGLFILSGPLSRTSRLGAATITTIAIASHLAHLVVAAAAIAALALAIPAWRTVLRTAPPLLAALSLLLLSNLVGNDRFAISPFGADFALARLVADGPARTTIQDACARPLPDRPAWRLCAWTDRLPTDADDFLWDPYGPVWADGYGPVRIAPEANEIVRATITQHPVDVLAAALRNTLRQLVRVRVGDALIPDHLDVTILPRLAAYFPPAETARFQASRQAHGTLTAISAPFQSAEGTLLALATTATILVAATQWRRNPSLAALSLAILVGLLANAFATGALSGPHDRYQARIAWLVLLPPLILILKRPAAPPPPQPAAAGSSAG